MDPISAISSLITTAINKFVPDKNEEVKAQVEEMQQQISVILAEANSSDKWTSRARPGFLYVMYIIILFALPMGFLSALSPTMAANIGNGFKEWLSAIPDAMWQLFGVGYLGYVTGRSWDKTQILKGKK